MKKALTIFFALGLLLLCACGLSNLTHPSAKPSASDTTESPALSPSATESSATSPSETETPTPSEAADTETPLTKEELASFTDYFNETENNGFLLSGYTEPSEIDLNEVLYSGAGIAADRSAIPQEEQDAYLKSIDQTELWGDLLKLTSQQLDDFLSEKVGITYEQTAKDLEWTYLKQYDAYYRQVSDTHYTQFEAVSGTKTSTGTYVIKCTGNSGEFDSYTVTMKKVDGQYLFVSNEAKKPNP